MFVHEDFSFELRKDCNFSTNSPVNSLFINITGSKISKKTIGVIYRPPNTDTKQFLHDFQVITKTLLHRKTECLITGDFNLNLLKHDVHSDTGYFLNGLLHDSFIPLITRPTRFTDSSSTLIDNIFTNKMFDRAVSGTLITDISDHLPVFYIKNEICQNSNVKFVNKTYYKRNITEQGINNLKMKLSETNWSDIANCSDPDVAYNLFLTRFTSYYNECLPLQCKTTKNKKQLNKPWITLCILKSIRKKTNCIRNILTTDVLKPLININPIKIN